MLGQATAALDQGHLLSQMRVGMHARIRRLLAAPEVCQRLREIGLGERQVLRLVVRSASVICQVCNSRLALKRELAAHFHVEPVGTLSP